MVRAMNGAIDTAAGDLEVVGDGHLPVNSGEWYVSFSRFRDGTRVRGRALLSARCRRWFEDRGLAWVLLMVERDDSGRPLTLWLVGRKWKTHRQAMRIRNRGYLVGSQVVETGIGWEPGPPTRIALAPSALRKDTLIGHVGEGVGLDPETLPTPGATNILPLTVP